MNRKNLTRFIVSVVFFITFAIATAFSQSQLFEHSVSGNIVSTDLSQDIPAITVEYSASDDYNQPITKDITLRIRQDSNIAGADGKQKNVEDLKVGDTVSATYEDKFTGARVKVPLWHDVLSMTITKTKDQTDKLEKPVADEPKQQLDTGY
jgi:hypothetical protein